MAQVGPSQTAPESELAAALRDGPLRWSRGKGGREAWIVEAGGVFNSERVGRLSEQGQFVVGEYEVTLGTEGPAILLKTGIFDATVARVRLLTPSRATIVTGAGNYRVVKLLAPLPAFELMHDVSGPPIVTFKVLPLGIKVTTGPGAEGLGDGELARLFLAASTAVLAARKVLPAVA